MRHFLALPLAPTALTRGVMAPTVTRPLVSSPGRADRFRAARCRTRSRAVPLAAITVAADVHELLAAGAEDATVRGLNRHTPRAGGLDDPTAASDTARRCRARRDGRLEGGPGEAPAKNVTRISLSSQRSRIPARRHQPHQNGGRQQTAMLRVSLPPLRGGDQKQTTETYCRLTATTDGELTRIPPDSRGFRTPTTASPRSSSRRPGGYQIATDGAGPRRSPSPERTFHIPESAFHLPGMSVPVPGISVPLAPEWVFRFVRNQRSAWAGIRNRWTTTATVGRYSEVDCWMPIRSGVQDYRGHSNVGCAVDRDDGSCSLGASS
jgi:hypothetical protein